MPKLYYTATSCGAANFMAAKASGLVWEAEQVDLMTKKTTRGDVDFATVNAKGNVPCLVLDDGSVLNENAGTLTFIGMQGDSNPLYPNDATKRAHINNALSYTSAEWHAHLGQLFNPALGEEVKAHILAIVNRKLTYMNDVMLKDKEYVTGSELSIADFYLFVTLTWTGYLKVDISGFPVVEAYFKRMSEHPAVTSAQEAMASNPETTA